MLKLRSLSTSNILTLIASKKRGITLLKDMLSKLYTNRITKYLAMVCLLSLSHRLRELGSKRRSLLESSLKLQQFYRDVAEEETWIKYIF